MTSCGVRDIQVNDKRILVFAEKIDPVQLKIRYNGFTRASNS